MARKRWGFLIEPALLEQLERRAAQVDRTASSLVRHYIRRGLREDGQESDDHTEEVASE